MGLYACGNSLDLTLCSFNIKMNLHKPRSRRSTEIIVLKMDQPAQSSSNNFVMN